jgi:hypothetical protein
MIRCPLCESTQEAGDACEVCGRPFARAEAVPADVPPAEGLEPTSHAAVAVDGEAFAELEPTRHDAVESAPDPAPGLEPTGEAPVDADAPPIDDLEPNAVGIAGDEPTPFPALVTCRYCRTPASPGEVLCGRCGMRLPLAAPAPREVALEPGAARICGCGTPIRGPVCPSCGARLG